ncbi:restriction endonuclease subunit S [Terrisporobacter petrolearius]|uniref:restriction endonuclease subunit S n=1 Tax=Terrisporobacter petrolearius TaxID=1460447 RepID=UPI001D16B538|nr:restriction endonuclease subunit S [Terrisporobacter petrolearius]MCC3863997.1 restriction endonuclease subunit S [Terrisporobacter petrolearius]
MSFKEWKKGKLSDIAEIIMGQSPKGEFCNNEGNGTPLLNGPTEFGTHHPYPTQFTTDIKKSARKGDLLFCVRGSTTGRMNWADREYAIGRGIASISPKNSESAQFIKAIMEIKLPELLQSATGSTFPNVSRGMLTDMVIDIPTYDEIAVINNILFNIENKIEVNTKINQRLEDIAQSIFKHWFVDFEFPNEEGKPYKSSGGEMVESELGMIPKGWEVGNLGKSKITTFVKTGIREFCGEKIYIATADVENTKITNNKTMITYDNRPSRANIQPSEKTIWFAKMKNSRKLIVIDDFSTEIIENYIISTGFTGLNCKCESLYYIWCFVMSDEFDDIKNSLCNGTTMQAINNENINKIKILIPYTKVLKEFNNVSVNIFKKIYKNNLEIEKLESLRNTILPKLISGEIRVPLNK